MPTAAAAFPQTVTGVVTGTFTWLPPPTEWLPEVVCEPVVALLAEAADAQPLIARPSTATAFPQTVTGTLTGTSTWLPPATEWLPEVVCDPVAVLAEAPDSPGAQPLIARPATDTEFPQTVTGTLTGTSTWLPPATE